ncbi:DUF3081 family protein [Vibrio makurazakiensis]|uniref:DUF3081 family protein n=1 Tax=Vibrio makurazakiensis TaxID=2910250 RepID=UPI003D101384
MSYQINPSDIVEAYTQVMTSGKPTRYGKELEGIEACRERHNGNIYLRGVGVQLTLKDCHGYHIDYSEQSLRDEFLHQIENLAAK